MPTITMIHELKQVVVDWSGFQAKLIPVIQNGKEEWTVNFPSRVIALDDVELRKYIMFLEFVEFYVQELNS